MAKQSFSVGQVLTAAQMTSLQQTAMLGGSATAKTASYTLVAVDAGTVVSVNSTSATTITVNTGLFSAGDTVTIQNWGSGAVTITAGTATVNTAGSLIVPQYDGGVLYFTSASAAIYFDFVQAGAVSPLTTKGDLYTFGSSDTRLGVGANGTTLVADSSEATGLKWATPSGGSTFSGCLVYKTGSQTITAATYQAITFTTESIDTDGYHSNTTNTSRITIPAGKAGKYLIIGNMTYGNFNTAKYLRLYKNGVTIDSAVAWQANSLTTTPYSMSSIADLAVGDYIEMMAYSDIQSTTSEHTLAVALLGA